MEKKIQIDKFFYTKLDYDENEYSIEHFCEYDNGISRKDSFIIKRLKDDKVLRIVSGFVSEIVQCKVNDDNYFVILTHGGPVNKRSHISCYRDEEKDLSKVFSYDCEHCSRLYNNTFELYLGSNNSALYNIEKLKQGFSKIHCDSLSSFNEIKEIYGEDILFVEKEFHVSAIGPSEAHDTITYGLDPNTLEIKTPIWSDNQQRYIKVLSEEEIKEKEAKYGDQVNLEFLYSGDSLEAKTIGWEIEIPLQKIAFMMDTGPSIRTPDGNYEINKEFVKGFKN